MKKFTLLFIFVFSIAIVPHAASASILSDVVNWLIPSELKAVKPVVEKGVGGILITADPNVLSGDTSRTFFLPAGTKRSFGIRNRGAVDLFLNTTSELQYQASPASALGDVPRSYALNVGAERTIVITNPSADKNVYLSKNDLGFISDEVVVAQPTVFISGGKGGVELVPGDKPTIAGFSLDTSNRRMTASKSLDRAWKFPEPFFCKWCICFYKIY